MSTLLNAKMRHVAEAFGVTVLVGYRPNHTWFANAGGCEWDAEGPVEAVDAVAANLARLAKEDVRKHTEAAAKAANALTRMGSAS